MRDEYTRGMTRMHKYKNNVKDEYKERKDGMINERMNIFLYLKFRQLLTFSYAKIFF